MGSGTGYHGGIGAQKKGRPLAVQAGHRLALFSSWTPMAQGMQSSFQMSAITLLPPACAKPGKTPTLDPWLCPLGDHFVVSPWAVCELN